MIKKYLVYLVFMNLLFPSSSAHIPESPYLLHTLYGDYVITEPILIELLECPSMQRLKKIHQYGINYYVSQPLEYDRYTHSIGVLALLMRFNAPLLEQIAGLLHDVSHTAFSHIADFLYEHHSEVNSYQDDNHCWFLEQTEIPALLQKYGITLPDILHKSGKFSCLERNIPELCADRLEYNLYGGVLENVLTQQDVKHIIDDLRFENNTWYFVTEQSAKLLGSTSLWLTEHNFGSDWNFVTNHIFSQVLKRAQSLNIISKHDIHFGIDEELWDRLFKAQDSELKHILNNLIHYCGSYDLVSDHGDIHFVPKFRGLDPLIKIEGSYKRLTELDSVYAQEFNRVQEKMRIGWHFTFK